MGYDEAFVPFAVAAITPLGCAWVASRFVPPTNKWIYSGVVIGTAFLSWKYIVPRMLTSMGYPVPFEAETWTEDNVCLKCNSPFDGCSCERCPQCDEFWNDAWVNCDDCHSCDDCCRESCPHLWEAESFSAESKFVKPYDRRGKIDFRRDNKGRYRRKLSVPLKKNAEWERLTTTLSEISAKRSMASMKGKAHNSPKYLGVKKVDWKVAPYDEEMESPYEAWGVFRKLS